MISQSRRVKLLAWQAMFLLFSTSWLLAPAIVHTLSNRVTLISQYEAVGQPYALFFRLCDAVGASLLLWFAYAKLRDKLTPLPFALLVATAVGMLIDPLFATQCSIDMHRVCSESGGFNFIIHAVESVLTAFAVAGLAVYDALTRRTLASIAFVVFQVAYGVLFLTQFASHAHFNTLSQFIYQCLIMLWLAWYCRVEFLGNDKPLPVSPFRTSMVRRLIAGWMLLNGLLAIAVSLAHIRLLGNIHELYLVGQNAWLAQHGIVIGVMMLYLSRHLLRGEMRARQILLIITGLEVLKYAAVSPSLPLVALYMITFCLLFVTVDDFQRGALPLTRRVRLKELMYMLSVLLLAALLVLLILGRDNRVARIASRSFDNFTQYALHSDTVRLRRREAVLLADTTTAFLIVSVGAILWILFKPYRPEPDNANMDEIRQLLERYSSSSEDFFKIWPEDKQYFFADGITGFVAYKLVGPVVFALAEPIGLRKSQPKLVAAFVAWARAHRLRVCFLAITAENLRIYEGMNILQIGASALVDTKKYSEQTARDKWWRWKRNRALKEGYSYEVYAPPHTDAFIHALHLVSDSWLSINGRREQGFALGYFDASYLQRCEIQVLRNAHGEIVAFINRLPSFNKLPVAGIDLLRHKAEETDAMPYLLANAIETARNNGFRYFDLGFVPFASAKGTVLTIVRTLSAGRFSAKGLEQFKNKFDPEWQSLYLAYDGDMADLALIALNLERAMELPLVDTES